MTEKQLKNLYKFLNGFRFVDKVEVVCAIEDFIRDNVEKNAERSPSYSELINIFEIANNYAKVLDIK